MDGFESDVGEFTGVGQGRAPTLETPRLASKVGVAVTGQGVPDLYRRRGKRVMDLVAVVPALVILLPVQAIVAVLVKRKLGSPVLFSAEAARDCGRQPFRILKFRTMIDVYDSDGKPLPDAVRLTPFGKLLRSTSLDELPELWNVVRGDMSLVGPRPLLVKYLPLYSPEQQRRHDVRPGLTGWAQVNGRNRPGWHEKLSMDVWYVDNMTLWLDLRILAKTVAAVALRRGVSANDHATAPEFTGAQR